MGSVRELGKWKWVVIICEDNSRELCKVYVVGNEEWVNVGNYKVHRDHIFDSREECLRNEERLLEDWEEAYGVDEGYRETVRNLLERNGLCIGFLYIAQWDWYWKKYGARDYFGLCE